MSEVYTENNISWNITKPLSTAVIYARDDTTIPVPTSILNKKKKILKGDSVVLVWNGQEPIITTPVHGTTLKSIFTSVEKGMMQNIPANQNVINIYSAIGNFLRKPDRLKLIKKFESGKLKPVDLVGDHQYFEGNITKKNHIWQFALGS